MDERHLKVAEGNNLTVIGHPPKDILVEAEIRQEPV